MTYLTIPLQRRDDLYLWLESRAEMTNVSYLHGFRGFGPAVLSSVTKEKAAEAEISRTF